MADNKNLDGTNSSKVCRLADVVFEPIENKLDAKPAEAAFCCCPLRAAVLWMGGSTVVIALLEGLGFVLAGRSNLKLGRAGRVLSPPLVLIGLVCGWGVWSVWKRELKGIRCNSRFMMGSTLVYMLAFLTIPLWVGRFCGASMEAAEAQDANDCAHMVVNASGCYPGDTEMGSMDGTIKIWTGGVETIVRECLPEGGACTVNPAVHNFRLESEGNCETTLDVAEALVFGLCVLWTGYYSYLLNSLIVRFEEEGGGAMVGQGSG